MVVLPLYGVLKSGANLIMTKITRVKGLWKILVLFGDWKVGLD